jgi:hypothetical protein
MLRPPIRRMLLISAVRLVRGDDGIGIGRSFFSRCRVNPLTFEHTFDSVMFASSSRTNEARVQPSRNQRRVAHLDSLNGTACSTQREMLREIAELDTEETWVDTGAKCMTHWLAMRYGISYWKAERWLKASHALEDLPLISEALAGAELSIDKVVELTRFATPGDEAELLSWAQEVSAGAIRRRGELANEQEIAATRDAQETRTLSWWFEDEGKRFAFKGELPAAQGAIVAKAIERVGSEVPVMPGEENHLWADARRVDALVAICSARVAIDPDQDRATVVVHARLEDIPGSNLASDGPGVEIEGGGVIHPSTLGRLLCNARTQTVFEDRQGQVTGVGRVSREPSAWMMRQIRYRDRECRFPGCGHRRFTQAHHIRWWRHGGRTDLDNLVLICSFHHDLVHEHGWVIRRRKDGRIRWVMPDGKTYRAGPGPPQKPGERLSERAPRPQPQPSLLTLAGV